MKIGISWYICTTMIHNARKQTPRDAVESVSRPLWDKKDDRNLLEKWLHNICTVEMRVCGKCDIKCHQEVESGTLLVSSTLIQFVY